MSEASSPKSQWSVEIYANQYDVIVVGSGASGSAAAQKAALVSAKVSKDKTRGDKTGSEKNTPSVLVISKDPIACSDSKISEGIMTVQGSGTTSDSVNELSRNMRVQGDDLADNHKTRFFAENSKSAYQWLQTVGLKPAHSSTDNSPIAMPLPMGGHTQARSVDHVNGGIDFSHACWQAITQSEVDFLEDAWLIDLLMHNQQVAGVLLYLACVGKLVCIPCKSVILACGGLSTLYFPHTDTMKGNTGDAYAVALRAGAQLVDMEQVQFIPFAVAKPGTYEGLILGEPVSAGVCGVLRDKNGKVVSSEMMTKTRAEISAVIMDTVSKGDGTEHGGCYLDLTENMQGNSGDIFLKLLKTKVPGIIKTVRKALGKDAADLKSMWEVKPSAHYHMGGIKTNQYGQALDKHNQCIVGLYACGQALGGLHGSNRLGSTSLAEAVIFGLSAGQHAVQGAENRDFIDGESLCRIAKASIYQWSSGSEKDHTDTKHPIKLLRALQKHAWQYLGPVRNARGLKTFASIAENLQQEISVACIQGSLLYNQSLIDFFETRNLLLCARAIAICADTRADSLGAHVRSDSNANPNRKQGSFAVFLDPATEQLQLHAEMLQKSSSLAHWRVSGKQYLKSMLIHLVRKLPLNIRDVLLVKMYSKALGDYQ